MVLAAALISLAVAAPPAAVPASAPEGQQAGASADSTPYSVAGVRRAATAGSLPSVDYDSSGPDRKGYRVTIDSRAVQPDPCSQWITACQPEWRGGVNPTWHSRFVVMAGPQGYDVPYTGMTNGQRLEAVASSIAFSLAFEGIVRLIQNQVVSYRADRTRKKIEKVRSEIRGELEELERANAAARQKGGQEGHTSRFDVPF